MSYTGETRVRMIHTGDWLVEAEWDGLFKSFIEISRNTSENDAEKSKQYIDNHILRGTWEIHGTKVLAGKGK